MKQKIVMKVQMNCQKCRTKACEIAASSDGVEEIRIEGEEKDQVVVIGEGVDSIRMVQCLRKKVGWAYILSIGEVKPNNPKQQQQQKQEEKKEQEKSSSKPATHSDPQAFQYHHHHHHYYSQFVGYDVIYEEPMPSYNCSLM
ncbi:heavy metal-associated isoprenylated plant protein 47-like [Telopea speciosissima]|uniref:heavy metal-associated isoprenylated plant protein 47-like n=1 Tax=Telopea speciosissima TaxID=54955 RepID=UPI001CC47495|nr:heavy metal-associated isoprenylated plant protein 47-like [Telopea speciosissima]